MTGVFAMILALAALQVLIPLVCQLADNVILWLVRRPAARVRQFGLLDPIEQNLQRASHGMAFMLLPVIAALYLFGPGEVGNDVAALGLDPRAHALASALLGLGVLLFVYGFARFKAGWRRCAGVRDGLLAAGAFVRLAAGVGVCWVLLGSNLANDRLLAGALFLVPLWLAITGFVRFVVLVRPAGRALPEVEDDIAASEFDWNE